MFVKHKHFECFLLYKLLSFLYAVPDRWNTGTLNHECAAAIPACVDYLAAIGRRAEPDVTSRRAALAAAYRAIGSHERELLERLIQGLWSIPGIRIFGITDAYKLAGRSPTCAIDIQGVSASQLATRLGEQGIFVGNGHFYALNLAEALGVAESGLVRIGITHYNTFEEVDRAIAAIKQVCGTCL